MKLIIKWVLLFKKLFVKTPKKASLAPYELEHLLEVQIEHGNVEGAMDSLKKLSRRLFLSERTLLINKCIDTGKFDYAFALTRKLPVAIETKKLLDTIVRASAFAGDYGTARAAALVSEQMKW